MLQVQELESELDAEQRRHAETQKNARKADRRLKELSFQVSTPHDFFVWFVVTFTCIGTSASITTNTICVLFSQMLVIMKPI